MRNSFQILKLEKGGDTFPLIGDSGTTLGLVCDLTSLTDITNILLAFSMGHKTSIITWTPFLLSEHNAHYFGKCFRLSGVVIAA